ncbi:CoA transferase [Sphaerisporangium perillae]|uniref:CoA transferase n=1 Tax=Sphaerisporangium perillae TaxID=2935860 RepID=UPI00200FC810|nr:CoA transferase [Sphaerisporangium perillae]
MTGAAEESRPAAPAVPAGAPLRGMRIVELSGYVATPLCGMALSQLGADVIRVEPIGGQVDRSRWPLSESGTSLYWTGLNKGKRAVEVDFRSDAGRSVIADLVTGGGPRGGIVVSNARFPGLSYEALSARRPDLIHVELTGKADGGTAVDYTVNAETGLPSVTGPAGAGPVNHVLPAWDIAAGLYLALGLLAAERRRLLTGEGQYVSVALQDVAMAMAGNLGYLAEAQLGGERHQDGNHVYGSYGRDFPTGDGHRVMLVVLTRRHWTDLLALTGLGAAMEAVERALGADFTREGDRYTHRAVISGLLEAWFARHTFQEVDAALSSRRLLYARYRTFGDLVADPAALLAGNPVLAMLDQPGVGPHIAAGSPLVMHGERCGARPAPAVGQHTGEVLGEALGHSPADLAALRDRGVIG